MAGELEKLARKSLPDRQVFSDEENGSIRRYVKRLVEDSGGQVAVADLLGVTQGFISGFLAGTHNAGTSVARKLAKVMGVSMGQLISTPEGDPSMHRARPRPSRRPRVRKVAPDRRLFSEAENDVLRREVRLLIEEHGSQVEVGKLLNIGQSSISAFLRRRDGRGAGGGLARAIAKTRGLPLSRLLSSSDVASPDGNDPYPNRARALDAARTLGLDERAAAHLRQLELEAGESDPSPEEWLRHLLRIVDELRGPKLKAVTKS